MNKKITNEKGDVYYGIHMYPGVAEYAELGKDPYRVFINENTIRAMDPTFAGRPVFVHHVDEVDQDINELRKDADGWVVESFFNEADGKHWVKFLIVSDKGKKAIQSGYRLSNAYRMKAPGPGGQWNGVSYEQQVLAGEYEHLAIVDNPRYEESVIMTPDEFKNHNETQKIELRRLANSKQGESSMLNFFTKKKIDNSSDLESTMVTLPKSKKELTISKLVNDMDDMMMTEMANGDHCVMVGDEKMKVNDLILRHSAMKQELEDLKKKPSDEKENDGMDDGNKEVQLDEKDEKEVEDKKMADKKENEDKEDKEDKKENEDEDKDKKKEKADDKKSNSKEQTAEDRAAAMRKKTTDEFFKVLKNAPNTVIKPSNELDLSESKCERGKTRYGSGN